MSGYDVIIVGAGTAGCVVAARLSEDPARRVLLLEAGPAAALPAADLLDARRVPGAEPDGRVNRWFPTRLAPGRDWSVSRGRVAGGSSATNGAYFVRARPADLVRWSGGRGRWTPQAVLPLQRALERDLDLGDDPLHGDAGPMPVHRAPLDHPAAAALVEAALGAGLPFEPDKNGATDHGVGAMPANAVGGVRWSTATAYLAPALQRPNLRVRGGTEVRGVRIAGGRTLGVVVDDGVLHADLVVLAAGALTTPELLLRSGVGPAAALRAGGVAVVHELPGVGAQLSDHPQVVVEWHPSRPLPAPAEGWTGAMLDLPADDGGDLEVLQSLVPMRALTRERAGATGPLPLLISAHAAIAPGSIALAAGGGVRIEQGYLRTAADRARLRQGVRAAVDLLRSTPFTGLSDGLVDLDVDLLRDDGALDAWVGAHLGTALHACSTVPWLLPDGSPGPVDECGAIRGLDGLVVADTSILPTAPSRGPAATAVLIGEVVAAHLRA